MKKTKRSINILLDKNFLILTKNKKKKLINYFNKNFSI